jgi:hypothetical protein
MRIRYLSAQKTTVKAICSFSLGLLTLVWLAGCSQNYGRIHWDDNVTQAFQAKQVEPDYNFYQYTVGTRVFAIVGLEPELEVQSKIWRELSLDTEDFGLAVDRIWYNYSTVPEDPRGAVIRNPSGEDVGVYFSSIRFLSIRFNPNNQVKLLLDTTVITGGGPGDRRTR